MPSKLNKHMGSQPLGIVVYEMPEYSGNPAVTTYEDERAFEKAIRARKIKEEHAAEQPELSAPVLPARQEQEVQAA
jgi:hypothetical protein